LKIDGHIISREISREASSSLRSPLKSISTDTIDISSDYIRVQIPHGLIVFTYVQYLSNTFISWFCFSITSVEKNYSIRKYFKIIKRALADVVVNGFNSVKRAVLNEETV